MKKEPQNNWRHFDTNAPGDITAGLFGLPFSEEEAQVLIIPAPWGVTVSYGGGTQDGPRAIYDASPQIDYYHDSYGADTWKIGTALQSQKKWSSWYTLGKKLRKDAEKYIASFESGSAKENTKVLSKINTACIDFHTTVKKEAGTLLKAGKLVGLVGGDHSTPFGLMQALSEKHTSFGILQIDAHCDLRDAYEGFVYSHASIMTNALTIPEVTRLVQVGIRDYSIDERKKIDASNGRIQTFFDADMKRDMYEGVAWKTIVGKIVDALPAEVYISFDIDGLDPKLCPNTGTPVPGGLEFDQALYLIRAVAESGKKIIGFDVNEVSPSTLSEWDANVGMRVLWNLANWAAKSQKITPLQ